MLKLFTTNFRRNFTIIKTTNVTETNAIFSIFWKKVLRKPFTTKKKSSEQMFFYFLGNVITFNLI